MKKPILVNWYDKLPKRLIHETRNPFYHIHGIKLPFRMMIVGASSSRKTVTALNVLANMKDTFEKVYVVCKSSNEPLYNYLREKLGEQISFFEFPDMPDINDKSEFYPDKNSLVIFDDLVLENPKRIDEFFIRGRKLGISMMFISQSYFGSSKMIRKNLNYLLLKQISSLKDLQRILSEYSLGITKEQFKTMYEDATSKDLNHFLMIDLDGPKDRKYRKNFDMWYEVEEKV